MSDEHEGESGPTATISQPASGREIDRSISGLASGSERRLDLTRLESAQRWSLGAHFATCRPPPKCTASQSGDIILQARRLQDDYEIHRLAAAHHPRARRDRETPSDVSWLVSHRASAFIWVNWKCSPRLAGRQVSVCLVWLCHRLASRRASSNNTRQMRKRVQLDGDVEPPLNQVAANVQS